MLTKTTVVAIQALLLLATEQDDTRPKTPKQLAARLGASPTYLGKILGQLSKGRMLNSVRGAHGGVLLARKPELITLLDVYTATQGPLIPNFCSGAKGARHACTFHTAMSQLHDQLEASLSGWTIADLAGKPAGKSVHNCRMAFLSPEQALSVLRSK
jgi:Rrf2 family protein